MRATIHAGALVPAGAAAGATAAGAGRRLTAKGGGGGALVEKLLDHGDRGMSHACSVLGSPPPVGDSTSEVTVSDAGGGEARVAWTGAFAPEGASGADAARAAVGGTREAGLEAPRTRAR